MRNMLVAAVATLLAACGAFGQKTAPTAQNCEALAQLELPGAKIVSAQTFTAGAFPPPQNMAFWMGESAAFYKTLGAFCHVAAEAKPSGDSNIKIEVWMPVEGWNGKLLGEGNGGFAGEIGHFGLGNAVKQGYAAVGTDTGHSAGGIMGIAESMR
jgi:feruloyl esterase